MGFVLLLFILANEGKVVEVHFADNAPKIDGMIEEIWQTADSAYNFVQHMPYEKQEPTEKTIVYVMQDKENLYFAFRCYAEKHKPIACLTADEDHVAVGIDPFDSKTTGYYFLVYGSGIIDDGWILDDGRSRDGSWDGVWYRALKVYDDRLEVEMKIPFKSIRYKKGLDEWGVQFMRYSAANRETDYWTEVLQVEEDMISKWCSLSGVNPQVTGYYFEFYPEGFVRYDKYEGDEGEFKPNMSLNLKWDITPQTTLNSTIYPDFAQIESDPFSLNLDRYPTYLSERRPFFLEGKDIFRMSDFGQGKGFFQELDIFYSRRIGKSMDGDAVPIIGGLKLTNKSENWNIGMLGAYTDEYVSNDTVIEPHRSFGVLRVKNKILRTSDIGMLISGTKMNDDYNYAFGLDGVYRKGINQLIVQGALSNQNEKKGWAFSSGFFGFLGNFLTLVGVEAVHDSFDVSNIGFVPWAGRRQLIALSGPYKQYPKGFLRNIFIAPGIALVQEPGDTNLSKVGIFEINPNFRNNWGFDLSFYAGRYYEADTNYFHRSVNLSSWGNLLGNYLNFGVEYSYTYNYWRGFLSYQGANWLSYRYSIIPQVAVSFSSNLWIEWDTTNTIVAMTPLFRPRIDVRFNADMSLGVFSEFVMQTPGTDLDETKLMTMRTGLLFSWNFQPKSWLYIALNDYRAQDEGAGLESVYQIGAIKAKYLLYL